MCEHSNKSYWAVLSCGTVYYAVQGGSNFNFCGLNPSVWHSNKSYWAVLSCGTVYYVVQGISNFKGIFIEEFAELAKISSRKKSLWMKPYSAWPWKWKLSSSTFIRYCLFCYPGWFYRALSIRPKIPAWISGNFHGRMVQTFPLWETTNRTVSFAWNFSMTSRFKSQL